MKPLHTQITVHPETETNIKSKKEINFQKPIREINLMGLLFYDLEPP